MPMWQNLQSNQDYYPFSDDGWGNSGILYIQFETNVIKISVQDFVMGESNTSGFGIDRTYILSKEEANQNSTEYDGEQKEQLLQYSVDWSEAQKHLEAEQEQQKAVRQAMAQRRFHILEAVDLLHVLVEAPALLAIQAGQLYPQAAKWDRQL